MSREGIQVGTWVVVAWGADDILLYGEVRHRPEATGDSWVIRGEDGHLHHVMMFECMSEAEKKRPKHT